MKKYSILNIHSEAVLEGGKKKNLSSEYRILMSEPELTRILFNRSLNSFLTFNLSLCDLVKTFNKRWKQTQSAVYSVKHPPGFLYKLPSAL